MAELFYIETKLFSFSIHCNNIKKRQQSYEAMLAKREELSKEDKQERKHTIRFSPILNIQKLVVLDTEILLEQGKVYTEIDLETPIFFENLQLQIEWEFDEGVTSAKLTHRLQRIQEAFNFTLGRRVSVPRLTGVIQTRNDVGWQQLPFEYQIGDVVYQQAISFEILPTKMDLHTDLPAMYQRLDKDYPLWRFSLTTSTTQDVSRGKKRGDFSLLWLAHFQSLRQEFEAGLQAIKNAPHNRLEGTTKRIRADRLKGRIPNRLAEKVREDCKNGRLDRRYRVEKKILSVDTPENRFIKMVVQVSKRRLNHFHQKLERANQAPDKQVLSDAFLEEIAKWKEPLGRMESQSFLRDVGAFQGLRRASLVLQQKNGYSKVYRIWQELKFYLDVFGKQATVSMKSVAEIYEVWCFLEIRRLLLEDLGFTDTKISKQKLKQGRFLDYQFTDGFSGAFAFERVEGDQKITARLAHEPMFKTSKNNDIYSYLVPQQPDILLEITFPNKKRCIWLFDAKYRIQLEKGTENEIYDKVPSDAINQMHRYRDALIQELQVEGETQKSRPVFGAFALYPGLFKEGTENPYREAIKKIGIGAFPLLPSAENSGNRWLLEFLQIQIGMSGKEYQIDQIQEKIYVQESVRIPYTGMKQVLYPDLVMTVALGGKKDRTAEYFEAFENGTANWFHIKQDTLQRKYKLHIVNEIQFLALGMTSECNPKTKQIDRLWPVKKVTLVPRKAISKKKAGKASDSKDMYYLFELGEPLRLKEPIERLPHQPIHNSIRLTTLSKLENAKTFKDVEAVYN